IEPTVGRVVWFYHWKQAPPASLAGAAGKPELDGACGPYCAPVADCAIDSEGKDRLNPQVIDRVGKPHDLQGVLLIQDGEDRPATGQWCEWMPNQKSVASQQAELEAQKPGPRPDGEYGPDEHEDAE